MSDLLPNPTDRRALLAGIGGLAAGTFLAGSAAHAGTLTPPGAPSPTMKTQTEVEPRVQLSDANTPGDANAVFVIGKPGSYYLMDNLSVPNGMSGIRIQARDVTLDLNGFTIRGQRSFGSVNGILLVERVRDVVIRNGFIVEFVSAIQAVDAEMRVFVRDVQVNLTSQEGFHLPNQSIVEHCTFESTGGITIGAASRVSKCLFSKGSGINAGAHSVVEGNSLSGTVTGIRVSSFSLVEGNTLDNGEGYGIYATATAAVIRGNVVHRMGTFGLNATGVDNKISDNSVRYCKPNYVFAPGNHLDLRISQIPETLSWPCKATLEGSLAQVVAENGITITSPDVTLDLGGHTLRGTDGAPNGVFGGANSARIVVRNGSIVGWDASGVQLSGSPDSVCEDLRVSTCGNTGIYVGDLGTIERCKVRSCAIGIAASSGSIRDCTSSSCPTEGIRMVSDGTVERCVVRVCEGYGIHVTGRGVVVQDNTVMNNPGVGLRARQPGGGNTFRDNHVRYNTTNYDFATGNLLELMISQVPQELRWPCVAKLEGNVRGIANAHGLVILSDDITIDLGGHSLAGVGGTTAYNGVHLDSGLTHQNITVRNGTIRDWPRMGAELTTARNVRVENVHFLNNNNHGLAAGVGAVIVNCTAYEAKTGYGFSAQSNSTLENCTATSCQLGFFGGDGCVLRGCTAGTNRSTGFDLRGASLIDCAACDNSTGVFGNSAQITGCTIKNNRLYGINAGGSVILDNRVENNGKSGQGADNAGISAQLQCRVEGNHCRDNRTGIYGWESGQNVIIRNTCSSNTTNWVIQPGNAVARIQIATTNPALISGNSYGGSVGTTDPTANITH